MKKIVLLLLLISIPLTARGNREESDKRIIYTSILPQQYFVEQIAGDRFQIEVMVSPGQDPHTFQVTPKQIAELSRAEIFFLAGVPFEEGFIESLRESSAGFDLVDTSASIPKRVMEGHEIHDDEHHDDEHHDDEHHDDEHHDDEHHDDEHHDDEHHDDEHHDDEHHDDEHHDDENHDDEHHDDEHEGHNHEAGAKDPHSWLNPLFAIKHSEVIRDTLIKADPEGAEIYRENFEILKEKLLSLDKKLSEHFRGKAIKRVYVYHPAYGYFADRYGLIQYPLELEGKEPGPRQVKRFIETIREDGASLIIVQPEFSDKTAQIIAKETGAAVLAVSPLAKDYIENLIKLAEAL